MKSAIVLFTSIILLFFSFDTGAVLAQTAENNDSPTAQEATSDTTTPVDASPSITTEEATPTSGSISGEPTPNLEPSATPVTKRAKKTEVVTNTPTEQVVTETTTPSDALSPSVSPSATETPDNSVTPLSTTPTNTPTRENPTTTPTAATSPAVVGQITTSPTPTPKPTKPAVVNQTKNVPTSVNQSLSQLGNKIRVPLITGNGLSAEDYYQQHKLSKTAVDSLLTLSIVYIVLGVLLIEPHWLLEIDRRSKEWNRKAVSEEMYRFMDRML